MDNSNNSLWFEMYLKRYQETIFLDTIYDELLKIKKLWLDSHQNGCKTIFVGNGGSAAMASHCSVDLTKNAGVRSVKFNEADLITCFSNDYGYENWISKALEFYADEGDTVVLISSSGMSKNMINEAKFANKKKLEIITLTGFDKDNDLSKYWEINLWVDSHAYNVVEMTHHIWLLAVIDSIIGSAEYEA